jgi:hypothetical protein
MVDGYEGIWTPHNSKEFEARQADIRHHFLGNSMRLVEVGVDLRRELPRAKNVSGSPWAFGADLKIAAWQINRQFAQAAASQVASAAAIARAYEIFLGSFHNRKSGSSQGRFDAA